MPYVLFKRVRGQGPKPPKGWPPLYFQPVAPTTEWKQDPGETLLFVALVHTPHQVADIVRRDPLGRYTLFSGRVAELQVAISVFMNQQSLDSLTSEWQEEPTNEG